MSFKEFMEDERGDASIVINWTPIVDMLNGVVAIFSPLLSIMVAVVPIILVGSVVGLVTGIFDDIIDGIRGYIRPHGKR